MLGQMNCITNNKTCIKMTAINSPMESLTFNKKKKKKN